VWNVDQLALQRPQSIVAKPKPMPVPRELWELDKPQQLGRAGPCQPIGLLPSRRDGTPTHPTMVQSTTTCEISSTPKASPHDHATLVQSLASIGAGRKVQRSASAERLNARFVPSHPRQSRSRG
jgi:hypothetical protein